MKTLTILSTLTVSALLATAANAGPQLPPLNSLPLQVASAAPHVLSHVPATAAAVQQAIVAPAPAIAPAPTVAAAAPVAPAPAVAAAATAAPAPASPVVVHGQNVTITIDGIVQPQIGYPAAPAQVAAPAAQPGVAPATGAPQPMQQMQAMLQAMMSNTMSTTYQPFPPDTQRKVNCLVATGGNYVTCGMSEAVGHVLGHVTAELAKCVNGVNVAGGCFAPKKVAQARARR